MRRRWGRERVVDLLDREAFGREHEAFGCEQPAARRSPGNRTGMDASLGSSGG
ncbi:MAG TPA: hypothetical protein VGG39_02135 [Polyangiaceae bacterium]|jgi:hypothetical protein